MRVPFVSPPPKSVARHAARVVHVALVAAAFGGFGAAALPAPPSAAAQTYPPLAYRLAATYRAPAEALRAGHYAKVADVTVRDDGIRLVLDARQHAVHAVSASGLPLAVWPLGWLANEGWTPRRIGAGPAARTVVLSTRDANGAASQARFDVLGADGAAVSDWEAAVRYTDVAVQADGTVLATRTRPLAAPTASPDPGERPRGGLDAFVDGEILRTVEAEALYLPVAVDVGPDGRVWVVDWRPTPAAATPSAPGATPRPSDEGGARLAGASPLTALQADGEGVVELSPDLAVLRRHPFYDVDDVAAGPFGVVVARQLEVLALGDAASPLWSAPSDTLALGAYGAALHLAAPPDGRLEVALDHCRFQGLARFDRAAPPLGGPRLAGALAWPPLDGPRHPVAIAVGPEGLALLTGRFEPLGAPPAARVGAGGAPQAVQRWARGGRLIDQLGLCGDEAAWFEDGGDAQRVRDLAQGDGMIIAARSDIVEGRWAEQPLDGWSAWPDALAPPPPPADGRPGADVPRGQTVAVDAADGLGVALDGGLGRLVWFDTATGAAEGATDLGAIAAGAVLADVALGRATSGGDRLVALVEPGGRRVHLLARAAADGGLRPLARIAMDVAPRRVAWVPAASAGPGTDGLGDVVVLDAAGWLARYASDGDERAVWAAPAGATVVDVAAGADGAVYAPFWRTTLGAANPPRDPPREVLDAGIYVFDPTETAEPAAQVRAPPCRTLGDKWAAPASLHLGGVVTVTLSIDHRCAQTPAPRRIVLVIDTSRSMAWDQALARATDHAIGGLARLTPADDVALIAFDDADHARLLAEPAALHGAVARALTALRPLGDSRLGPGLALAAALVAVDRPTDVLVATDGRLTDSVFDEAQAVRDAGGRITFLVYPHGDFGPLDARTLGDYAGDRARVIVSPTAERVADLLGPTPSVDPSSAPTSLAISDTLPADMRYVEGSAEPAAAWDPATRTLRWMTTLAPGGTRSLRYQVVPETIGWRPTNVRAVAALTDVNGTRHDLVLPVPRVYAWDRSLLPHRAYLPLASRNACLRPLPMAVVLALDTSSSMGEPDGIGRGTKLDAARSAAARLLGGLRPGIDAAAIVAFDARARTVAPLGASPDALAAALAGLATAQGTALDLGLLEAGQALNGARAGSIRAMILLSDGHTSGRPEDAWAAAAAIEARGVRRYTVALGADADVELLGAIASGPDAFVAAPSADGLDALFGRLLERVRCAAGG